MDSIKHYMLVLWICFTGSVRSDDTFHFLDSSFRRSDYGEDCKICYGKDDCFFMSKTRCELYTMSKAILADEDSPQNSGQPEMRQRVDELMTNLIETAFALPVQECIPFISEYTDCNKDNVCLGCVSCSCTDQGRWTCSSKQRCIPEDIVKVDHSALIFAMETLREDSTPSRVKRSAITKVPDSVKASGIWNGKISERMFNESSLKHDDNITTPDVAKEGQAKSKYDSHNMTKDVFHFVITTEFDYLLFNDVLNNIGVQVTNFSENNINHKNLEEINVTYYNRLKLADHSHILEWMEPDLNETSSTLSTTTELITIPVKIDLLELARKKIENYSSTSKTEPLLSLDNEDTFRYTSIEHNTVVENSNEIDEWNTFNIRKRDLTHLSTPNVIRNKSIETKTERATENNIGDVYQPLNKIIKDRQQELKDLIEIRRRVIDILQHNNSKEFMFNKTEILDKDDSHFSFYNVEIRTNLENLTKRNDEDKLDKFLRKLEQDIFIVMKDVSVIHKLSNRRSIPEELKNLFRAMRHYLHEHIKTYSADQHGNDSTKWNRQKYIKDDIKKHLFRILQVIDSNMFPNNTLSTLSPNAKRIVRRILKTTKIKSLSPISNEINYTNYDLITSLRNIEANWSKLIDDVNITPWDKLHHMKIMHFLLESDINKMNDALVLIDFANRRRIKIIRTEDEYSDELKRINNGLESVHNKLKILIELEDRDKKQNDKNKQNKKETFLEHLRRLYKASKADVIDLIHKKIPKTKIIRELARQRQDELTNIKIKKIENVMRKWQNNLKIHDKRKRSISRFENLKTPMKNILPKYLRKLNPKTKKGMQETKKN